VYTVFVLFTDDSAVVPFRFGVTLSDILIQ